MSRRALGTLALLTAATCWGLLGPVARIPLAAGVSPIEVAFWRAVIGGLFFGVHAGVLRARRPGAARYRLQSRRDVLLVAGFGVVGVALFYAVYQWAVQSGGAALASVLLYTAPGWVAVFGVTMLGETLSWPKLGGVVLTLAGVAGIAASGARTVHVSTAAVGWGLLSGLTYALYYPFGKRLFARVAPVTVFAGALPVGALALAPFVSFADKSTASWMALLGIGAVSTYGAYVAYGAGLQRMEASRASILATLEPVVAAVAAHLWWGERFGTWGYAGAGLVIAAAGLAAASNRS